MASIVASLTQTIIRGAVKQTFSEADAEPL